LVIVGLLLGFIGCKLGSVGLELLSPFEFWFLIVVRWNSLKLLQPKK
jgi:hypothetical protein